MGERLGVICAEVLAIVGAHTLPCCEREIDLERLGKKGGRSGVACVGECTRELAIPGVWVAISVAGLIVSARIVLRGDPIMFSLRPSGP